MTDDTQWSAHSTTTCLYTPYHSAHSCIHPITAMQTRLQRCKIQARSGLPESQQRQKKKEQPIGFAYILGVSWCDLGRSRWREIVTKSSQYCGEHPRQRKYKGKRIASVAAERGESKKDMVGVCFKSRVGKHYVDEITQKKNNTKQKD